MEVVPRDLRQSQRFYLQGTQMGQTQKPADSPPSTPSRDGSTTKDCHDAGRGMYGNLGLVGAERNREDIRYVGNLDGLIEGLAISLFKRRYSISYYHFSYLPLCWLKT